MTINREFPPVQCNLVLPRPEHMYAKDPVVKYKPRQSPNPKASSVPIIATAATRTTILGGAASPFVGQGEKEEEYGAAAAVASRVLE